MSPALQKAVDDAKQAVAAVKDQKGAYDRACAEWSATNHDPPKPGDDPVEYLNRAIARNRVSERLSAGCDRKYKVQSEAARLLAAAHKAFAEEVGLPVDLEFIT